MHFSDINECGSSPCQNNGTCTDHVNRYTCSCAAGYSGINCETSKFMIDILYWIYDSFPICIIALSINVFESTILNGKSIILSIFQISMNAAALLARMVEHVLITWTDTHVHVLQATLVSIVRRVSSLVAFIKLSI